MCHNSGGVVLNQRTIGLSSSKNIGTNSFLLQSSTISFPRSTSTTLSSMGWAVRPRTSSRVSGWAKIIDWFKACYETPFLPFHAKSLLSLVQRSMNSLLCQKYAKFPIQNLPIRDEIIVLMAWCVVVHPLPEDIVQLKTQAQKTDYWDLSWVAR